MADGRLSTSSVLPPEAIDELLDTVTAWTEHLFGEMAEAFMSTDGDAPLALHRALATLLREIADAPGLAHRATVELPALGPLLYAQRDRALELFSTFLGVGLSQLPESSPDPSAIALCIAGGLWETIRRYALERRLHELPAALPSISHFCLSTFFGADQARRVTTGPAGSGLGTKTQL